MVCFLGMSTWLKLGQLRLGGTFSNRYVTLKQLLNLANSAFLSEISSAYHLYGNFGEKFPSSDTGIFLGTENRNGIELYHLQNAGKFFAFFST